MTLDEVERVKPSSPCGEPKPLRRFPAAQPINHHCVSDLGIKFHCEHPSSPSMPINGIETAYKDRYTFAPLSQRAVPIQWYTLPLRFIPW